MEQIACKECTSPDCHGCNMYRLERMLMSGKLDALMDEKRGIKMDADARPVVRGKWIPDYDYTEYDYDGSTPLPEPRKFQDGWQCSLCGAYEPSTVNFCPNCGADMREESR